MKTIYELELHEQLIVNATIQVLRVPGGWLYMLPNKQPVLVQYDSKFEFYGKIKNSVPAQIEYAIKEYFKLPKDFLSSKSREGDIPIAKKFMMKIMYDQLELKHWLIAEYLHMNRTSVTNGLMQINRLLSLKKNINNQYNEVLNAINENNLN